MRCKGSKVAKSKMDKKDPRRPMLRGSTAGPSEDLKELEKA